MDDKEELTPFEEDVLEWFDKAIDYLAEASAAQTWSTPGDLEIEKHGENMFIIANFGEWWAVNGDLVWAKGDDLSGTPGAYGDIDIPDDFVVVRGGGRIPCTEEEISIEHIASRIYIWMEEESEKFAEAKFTEDDVLKVLRKHKGKEMLYTSVSGDATYYTKRKADKDDSDE